MPSNPSLARDAITNKLATLLVRVDETLVTRKQKLKFYRLGICLQISWDLTIRFSEFPLSWIEKTLNPLATRYLKRMAGLARPADPARLFRPQNAGGLNLSLPSDLYQKLQVDKASLLITSRDGGVNHAVSESLRKESIQQRAKFHPFTMAQEAFASNPGASGKAVARKAKQTVTNHLSNKRLEHSLSLDTQGKLFHLVDATASAMWSKAIQLLPTAQMKFALNSAYPPTQCQFGLVEEESPPFSYL